MTPGRRELLVLGAVGVAALAAGGVAGALAIQSRSGAASLLSGSFADLAGRPRKLSEWQGRVALVNFWATWCAPCLEEVPLIGAAAQKYREKGFSAIGIGIDNGDKIREFAAKFSVQYDFLVSGPEAVELMKRLGNPAGGLPFSVLLDRRGRIAERKLGPFRAGELEGVVEPLLR
jgi:thiol-disulfide isomerase/thioredoxin